MTRARFALAALALTAAALTSPVAHADNSADDPTAGVSRTELQRSAAPTPGFEIIQTRFEIPVGKESGRHSHPGPELGYIVQGDVDMLFDDRPTQHLHSGDPFLIPANVVHNARNVGSVRTLMLSTYVVPVDQPLVTRP
ncbi:cupin domain-containing protein [Mycobacterium sp. TNTM28]|uniref:Cupin domain-containing protein n=1 Tax=[Mycobacterium] fortunisiensis TaxID=2600579 RepID=A0ABS6KUR5_9MYCO|nr:cupin domain-containing protein [[Mycobacterium] fortunisiensis]MBU9767300.1 cupin domain-containing protein [[Mycobacterium] fortunisiensis]